MDFARHRLEIKDAGVSVEGVRAELGGSLESDGRDLRVAFKLRVPSTSCQTLLEAAPPALLPQLQGLRMGGTLGLDARVEFDTAAPKETQVEWNLHNQCSVIEIPEDIDPQRFHQPFVQLFQVGGEHLALRFGQQRAARTEAERVLGFTHVRRFTLSGLHSSCHREGIKTGENCGSDCPNASADTK